MGGSVGRREWRVGSITMFLNLYIWNTWNLYTLNKILKIFQKICINNHSRVFELDMLHMSPV